MIPDNPSFRTIIGKLIVYLHHKMKVGFQRARLS